MLSADGKRKTLNKMTDKLKAHGNVGNSYAKKYAADERNAKLHIGCAQSDKNAWVAQAQSEGKKLGVWVIEQLNKSVG